MNKKRLISLGFILVGTFPGFIFSACDKSTPSAPREMSEAEKRMKEGYEALDAKKNEHTTIPSKVQLAKEPYKKKSILFYKFDPDEKDNNKWRRNFFGTDKMGSSLYSKDYQKIESKLAKNPEEVGIIALMPECKKVEAGQYGSVATAYKERCELILVDPELSAVVYRKVFEGELDAIKSVKQGESVVARVDGNDVIEFLDYLRTPNSTTTSPSTKPDKK